MATWTNGTKASTTFTNGTKVLGLVSLLIESPYKLLIGEGYYLSIDPTVGSGFGLQSKSSSTFANQTKN